MKTSIIIASLLVSLAILFSGGVYTYDSPEGATVFRLNRFTGNVDFCVVNRGCWEIADR